MQETWVWYLDREDPLEESMATQSSILAWRIPMDRGAWQAIQSLGSQRVGHNWATKPSTGQAGDPWHLCHSGRARGARRREAPKSLACLWLLCSSVALALAALTVWQAVLISRGERSIGRHISNKECRWL